ncbi:MAG: tetratricopeptide repeat protein [Thermodesulfovibrionales bacterium]|nr:tetratricopeptide repeat protein [Thermodesulfovibrionales bacterium]
MGKASRKKKNAPAHPAPIVNKPLKPSPGLTPLLYGLLKKPVFHLVLIALLGLLAYSNTFHAPFQWDENILIAENPVVKDLGYFLSPSKAKGLDFYEGLKRRYVGYLTFGLNYKIHGTDVTGYHVVNIAVHIINGLLVYLLVLLTFRTPFLENSRLKEKSNLIALLAALLFVSHPVQTEAVTYIFQRLASLSALFYMLSLVLYIKSRLTEKKTKYAFYALSILSAVLAMKTKENAFTLPAVVILYEFLFFRDPAGKRIMRLAPFALTMPIIPLTLMGTDKPAGEMISGIGPAMMGYMEGVSRWDYLFTEFRVIMTYIRLLFLPVNQNIDYDYPVSHSLMEPQVFLSLLFLLCLFAFAIYLLYRSAKHPELVEGRLISFGIFWFFITLSVESSIIPIPSVICEYRVYLPSIGAFVALTAGAFVFVERIKSNTLKNAAFLILFLMPVVFSGAAYARNGMWATGTSLWEDALRKSPQKAGVHYSTGFAFWSNGLTTKAIGHYRNALRLNPQFVEAENGIGIAYEAEGQTEEAIRHYEAALKIKPDFTAAHINLGNAWGSKGQTDKAAGHYRAALRLNPGSVDAHFNLGLLYFKNGDIEKAQAEFEEVMRLNPKDSEARSMLDRISGG